ncbi:MAG: Asp-tRNA(Asn)/Glu-tRNA(Gln) amidotransferase subunit GatC [Planctomycetota bacterium]|jgi:aspartyl-tRNA(Asn)/glutamyl-tRNA(Gln) amidotransferase subunit C
MGITREDVHYVANLARLHLTPEEEERFQSQLGKILGFVDHLQEVDVAEVEPYLHAAAAKNVFRCDRPHQPLPREKALQNSARHDNEGFIVPKVVDSGSGA